MAIRMVVGQYQRDRSALQRRFNHAAGVHGGPVDCSFLKSVHAVAEQAVAAVAIGNLEHLMAECADAHAPEGRKSVGVRQRLRTFRRLLEVQRRGGADDPERDWRDRPYAVDLLQLFWRGIQDSSEVFKASNQRLGGLLDV